MTYDPNLSIELLHIPFNVYPCYPFSILLVHIHTKHTASTARMFKWNIFFDINKYEGKFDLADVRIIEKINVSISKRWLAGTGPFFTSFAYCYKVSRLSSRLLTDALIKMIINNFFSALLCALHENVIDCFRF